MPIRTVDTEAFIAAIAHCTHKKFELAEWVLTHQPKIAIEFHQHCIELRDKQDAEFSRRASEDHEKRIEAQRQEKARQEAEKKWVVRFVLADKAKEFGQKFELIKWFRLLSGMGLAESKAWSEMLCDYHTTEQQAKQLLEEFQIKFPMLKGGVNIWKI